MKLNFAIKNRAINFMQQTNRRKRQLLPSGRGSVSRYTPNNNRSFNVVKTRDILVEKTLRIIRY